jgi:hypothetical protein
LLFLAAIYGLGRKGAHCLGDVLADLVQSPTATRTNRRCGIDDALARQMSGSGRRHF